MNGNDNRSEINKMGTRFDDLYIYRIGCEESKEKLKEKIYNKYSFKPRINVL